MAVETIITCDKCHRRVNGATNGEDIYWSVELKLEQEFDPYRQKRKHLILCSDCLAATPQINELMAIET
jgi:hypothetical protein